MRRSTLLATVGAAAALILSVGCPDQSLVPYCVNIPASDGCPGSDLTACNGPTCSSVYACDHTTGAWSYVGACPAHDAGADVGASTDAGDGAVNDSRDAHASGRDVNIDVPPGAWGGPGSGCPDLENPDCTLGSAIDCVRSCCGCQDLYVCADGGWNPWGTCNDGGQLIAAAAGP